MLRVIGLLSTSRMDPGSGGKVDARMPGGTAAGARNFPTDDSLIGALAETEAGDGDASTRVMRLPISTVQARAPVVERRRRGSDVGTRPQCEIGAFFRRKLPFFRGVGRLPDRKRHV